MFNFKERTMARHVKTTLRVTTLDAQGSLPETEEHTFYPRSAEVSEASHRFPSGWWIAPALVLGLGAWVLIIRAALAYAT